MDMMLNGKPADISDFEADELAAAVLISLFSWRKSNPDDGVRAPNRQGWWGDTFAQTAGDRIDFYASRVHSIYGSSSSVQPPAMAALILIKS